MVGYKMMLTRSAALQPRQFRTSTVCGTVSEKLRKKVKELNAKIFQSDALQKVKEHIDSLQQDLSNSTDLILKEQQMISGLEGRQNLNAYCRCQPISFIENLGLVITSSEKTCRENDKTLKRLEMGLSLHFNHNDSLLSDVKDIHKRNKAVSKIASKLASQFYDYRSRFNIEVSWISKFAKTVEEFSGKFSAVTSEIIDVQKDLSELSQIIDELTSCKEPSEDFKSQLCALRAFFMTLESTELLSKSSAFFVEAAANFCFLCKNLSSILGEKAKFAARFYHIEQCLKQKSPHLEQSVGDLQLEVDIARRSYDEKISRLPKDMQGSDIKKYTFKKVFDHSEFSWRCRELNNRNILPPIRTQGRGECAYVSTVSAVESLYKKQHATKITLGGQDFLPEEFIVTLSHTHLQDIVTQFYASNERKASEKLDVCLEQMEHQGVISESAYNDGNAKIQEFQRYRINGFEALNLAGFEDACNILREGNVLIGNFRVTKDYHRLSPDDIYQIPADAVYETNITGQICSHCVVIVGFGVTPDGLCYYIYQNSYGPDWGSGGFGRVASDCLKYLYSASV